MVCESWVLDPTMHYRRSKCYGSVQVYNFHVLNLEVYSWKLHC